MGVVINTAMKPGREVMLAIEHYILGLDDARYVASGEEEYALRFFLGSAATTIGNLADFVSSGLDAIIFCGIARQLVFEFLRAVPEHPPVVLATYSELSEAEWAALGAGGAVMLDNEQIGRRAADFLHAHGLAHFATIGRRGWREDIAGKVRSDAFIARIAELTHGHADCARFVLGSFSEANEDYWETEQEQARAFLAALPHPCGVFVNGDHLAYRVADGCRRLGLDVPGQIELIGVDNHDGFCERATPAITRIVPDFEAFAIAAAKMALRLAEGERPVASEHGFERIPSPEILERGSTAAMRDFGLIATRAKEFIRLNAHRGIKVQDVADHLHCSRRTLEVRMRRATGRSVGAIILATRLSEVCRLLRTTNLTIGEIVERAGFSVGSDVSKLFKRRFGVTMRDYRLQPARGGGGGMKTPRRTVTFSADLCSLVVEKQQPGKRKGTGK